LSLRLEWNQESFNQYRNKKELLGINRADFFNVESMGGLLNNEGFLQATIISWNDIPHANWFKEKIEKGIFLVFFFFF
jgi:hypothetical protein